MRRRTFIRGCSTLSIAGLAGCSDTTENRSQTEDGTTTDDTSTEGGDEYPSQYENVFPTTDSNEYRELTSNKSWTMLRGGVLRHGSSENSGPDSELPAIQWHIGYDGGGNEPFYQFEPIIADGMVFIPSRRRGDYTLYAIDEETGDIEWKKEGYGTKFTPIFKDGRLYVSGDEDDGNMFAALDAETGETLSTTPLTEFEYVPNVIGPVAIVDGSVILSRAEYVMSISLETGAIEWKTQPLSGEDPQNRQAGVEVNNVWETGVTYHADTGTILCGDTTGFVYAIDVATGEGQWARAVSTGDIRKGRPGQKTYEGEDFYKTFVPTVTDNEVLFEIGTRTFDGSRPDGNTIISTHIESGELSAREVPVDNQRSSSLQGRRINDGLHQRARTLEDNFNYPTIEGDWMYYTTGGALVAINDRTGETWAATSDHSDSGLVCSPIVGENAVYAIEYHKVYSGVDVTTIFAVDKESGEVLWSGETPTQVRHLAIANGTLYAAGEHVYALY